MLHQIEESDNSEALLEIFQTKVRGVPMTGRGMGLDTAVGGGPGGRS